jgi:hypothetical protein
MLATGVNNLFAAAVLAAGGTNTFAASVLAAGGTFGAAVLFEFLPIMLGIGGGPTRPAASQLLSTSTMVGMKEVIFS